PDLTHSSSQRLVVEQLHDLARQVLWIVALGIERGVLRGDTPLHEVVLYDRLAERHVLHDLVHRRLVIHFIGDIRIHADIGGVEHREQLAVRNSSREGHVSLDAELPRERLHRGKLRAAAYEAEMNIGPAELVHDVTRRLEQAVDAFLTPHDPDIADEIAPTLAQLRHRRKDLESSQVRAAANDEHFRRRQSATLDCDAAVRFVRRNGHIRGPESQTLERQHQSVEEVASLELRLVQLGVDVAVIEQEPLTEELVKAADEKKRVGRIACVNRVEALLDQDANGQYELREKRPRVLCQVSERSARLERLRMTVDGDAIDLLVAPLVAFSFRTDDRYAIPCRAQRPCLLPNAAVERARQVLHDDEYSSACARRRRNRIHHLTFDSRHRYQHIPRYRARYASRFGSTAMSSRS